MTTSRLQLLPEVIEELPYNNPFFEEIDLGQLGKIREGTPAPAAFLVGLYPLLQDDGYTNVLFLSHNIKIQFREGEKAGVSTGIGAEAGTGVKEGVSGGASKGVSEGVSVSSNVIGIQSWADVVESLCSDIGKYFTYVTYDPAALDSLLKYLTIEELKALQEDGHLYSRGAKIWYTPGHKLTLLRGDGSEARIQVIGTWSRRLTMEDAFKRAGLPNWSSKEPATIANNIHKLGAEIKVRTEVFLNKSWGDISTPGVLTKHVLSHDLKKVDISYIPKGALELAYKCLHAPWIEMIAQGFFPQTYDYDIDSAYPNEIAKLIICDEGVGKWINKDAYVMGAAYGFCKAVISMNPIPGGVSPIRFRKTSGKLFSPFGTWIGYITKPEIDFILKYNLGDLEILDGWWFVPAERIHPFHRTVERLLDLRRQAKGQDPIMSAMMKSVAARMNGYFLQKYETLDLWESPVTGQLTSKWVAGGMFNPIYACEVMTQTKIKLAEIAMTVHAKQGQVLALTVDGLVSSIGLKREKGTKLVVQSPAVIVAPLIMHLEDKASRVNILRELWNEPSQKVYQIGDERRVTLLESLKANRIDLLASKLKERVRIRVGSDVTRVWTDLPTHGSDLLSHRYISAQPPIEYVMLGTKSK
jgi:hypothetical protein